LLIAAPSFNQLNSEFFWYLDRVINEFGNTPEDGCSSERESVGVNSRIQEFNCERAIPYHTVLSD
jgi:hypothetical protein